MVLPADDCAVRLRCLENNRAIIPAFDSSENVQWYGNRIERAIAPWLDVLDGQAVILVLCGRCWFSACNTKGGIVPLCLTPRTERRKMARSCLAVRRVIVIKVIGPHVGR